MATSDLVLPILGALGAAVSISWLFSGHKKTPAIPAITGSNGIVSSYLAALHILNHANAVIQDGYAKYREGIFRVPMLFRWEYVASGARHILEIAAAPEHILSFQAGVAESLQSDWTMGPEVTRNPYHVSAIRGSLTRNLGRCFPEVRDEIVHAFDHVLALEDREWKLIPALPSVMQVVARTSNRLFVGLPLCREQEYLDLNIDWTVTIFTRGQLMGLVPEFLKPIFAPLLTTRKSSLRHALKFLGPLLDERLEKEKEYGPDWSDRPNDLISWLLDLAQDEERTTPALALRVLVTNMAAIHTSSTTLTAALYDLTAYPEHIPEMRAEAERVVEAEGWTKAALGNMHKIDSFLRESQRMRGAGPVAMGRKVIAPDGFTFSDGTTVPHGAFLSVPGDVTHFDEANYANANVFDGFRFSRMREVRAGASHDSDDLAGDNADSEKTGIFNRHMVSTAPDHVVFGHGRHACPGRFFAATELKAMLAHILINYDVKAETAGVRPADTWFAMLRMPNPKAKIWVRRREQEQ
ncbi:cytochrome P450 [Mycena crocata]|nr:cytochrome P450 [Mycena crocata]